MYKVCPTCKKVWKSRSHFEHDILQGECEVLGKQEVPTEMKDELYLFNHSLCQTTLAIYSSAM